MAETLTRCDRCGDYFLPGDIWLKHRAACQERPEDPNPPTSPVVERPCRACGRKLRFVFSAKSPNKTVPLEELDRYEIRDGKAVRTEKVYVNHYQTCPRANDFHCQK